MTILAIGTCLIISAAAQTNWQAPRTLRPVLGLGERSYEVYLTHMFVVFALFHLFLWTGKPMALVAPFFIATILVAGLLGGLTARFYSDPMNLLLRGKSPLFHPNSVSGQSKRSMAVPLTASQLPADNS